MSLTPAPSSAQPEPPGWEATLALRFEARRGRTVLAERSHTGPLMIQRVFHPEPDGCCHAYVLHPPGGIAGGDQLRTEVTAADAARVLITTPAATKCYRSGGAAALQLNRLRAASGTQLEWVPQETIVFAGAELVLETSVELAAGAGFLGWDVLCLGRPMSGERFDRGSVEQRLDVRRDGEPLLLERAQYTGGGVELRAAWGLGGHPVFGTLVCVPPSARPLPEPVLDQLRGVLEAAAGAAAACSCLGEVTVCRYLGDCTEQAQAAFRAAWVQLRQACFGKNAIAPRIWAT